jgi:phytoene dehydrogenase-like protein
MKGSVVQDAVIVGGGANGLVTAAFLARAGLRPLVLERSDRIGGCAITSEVAPGFRCPTLAHRAAIDSGIVRELALERHGLQIIRPSALVCAPAADGRALTLWANAGEAARDIARFSARDAEQYPRFLSSVAAVSRVLRTLAAMPPPGNRMNAVDILELLKTGRMFRGLGKTDAYRLLRWLPMPVADFVHEWFETEPLCATVATGGRLGSLLGPRSAGSAAILLALSAGEGHPIATGWSARGGPGALSEALAHAARQAGTEIRTDADVAQVVVEDGTAKGVILASGEQIGARHVVSNADPRRTFLKLIDPVHLPPEFIQHVRNIRMRGALAKINYALSSMPTFTGLAGLDVKRQAEAMAGCIRLCSSLDDAERAYDAAKYGGYADDLLIELTIPSITDPNLAPAGQHVMSAYVQFAPYELRETTWDAERERLGDVATRLIAKYAPGVEQYVLARHVITPLDLERIYGLTGGHIFHGELALDQLFAARPLLGWARYHTPIRNLYLCGSGTHPGTGLDGRSGALAAREIIKSVR